MTPTPYKEMFYNDALFHDVIKEIRFSFLIQIVAP